MERKFDAVVIGAGPAASEVLAGRLSKRGGKLVAIRDAYPPASEESMSSPAPDRTVSFSARSNCLS